MAKEKKLARQDTDYAINPGNNNETSIKITSEICSLFFEELPFETTKKSVTFNLHKEDFIKSACGIISSLPLLDKHGKTVAFKYDLSDRLLTKINDFFGDEEIKPYSCELLFNVDRNSCIQGFDSSFNIRSYTVESWSTISFNKKADCIDMRLLFSRPNVSIQNQMQPKNLSFPQVPFSISKIIKAIGETGLLYDSMLVKRFAFSLMSKRFLILSGLAGSGKTQLALAFASALVENVDEQMCVVSVGADWTNREPLLGFPNALQEGCYVKPECGALDLLIRANKEENKTKPYFLILDEMNMSYVERYFADFLSAMESHEPISLWKGNDGDNDTVSENVPSKIGLPKNLFIIGTINVDETTYMFSPKVLDRANVIEFKISEKEMSDFLSEMQPVDRASINGKAASMGASFVELSQGKELTTNIDSIVETLNSFFVNLKSVNAEFGYRSATEIYRFIAQAEKNDDSDGGERLTVDQILDCAMVQKLLPKLHGSRKKLEPVLQALWKECFASTEQKETISISRENVEKAKYPLTADKIQRMYEAAYTNGFTSFAEA